MDKPAAVVATFVDITEKFEREEELARISVTDHLTKIYNRLRFSDTLEKEMVKSVRYGYPVSVIMFDIDHFKQVNDTYGHDAGDRVLVETVETVQNLIRETDLFARWGGEEFIILLVHTALESAVLLAERIRLAIGKNRYTDIEELTCSFGVSALMDGDSIESVMKRVDENLYSAKKGGRNRVIPSPNPSPQDP